MCVIPLKLKIQMVPPKYTNKPSTFRENKYIYVDSLSFIYYITLTRIQIFAKSNVRKERKIVKDLKKQYK